MNAWTDYPFTWLGDTAGMEAPAREIDVLSCDDNKYCRIKVCGGEDEIKSGYIYQAEGHYGEVPPITRRQLVMLAHNAELTSPPVGELKRSEELWTQTKL